MCCLLGQISFAQSDNFQGKLVYQLSIDVTFGDESFNRAVIDRTKEQIGNIDSVVIYIKDKYYKSELKGEEVTQYFQYVPTENLIYEFRKGNDYVLIYPSDYEMFPVEESGDSITYDSTITIINGLACQSFTISSDFDKRIYYYSESLHSDSPILESKYITNFLRTYAEHNFIPVKVVTITPFFTIGYELINMEFSDIPMTVFELPELGKTHKKMQRMMGEKVKVKKIK